MTLLAAERWLRRDVTYAESVVRSLPPGKVRRGWERMAERDRIAADAIKEKRESGK